VRAAEYAARAPFATEGVTRDGGGGTAWQCTATRAVDQRGRHTMVGAVAGTAADDGWGEEGRCGEGGGLTRRPQRWRRTRWRRTAAGAMAAGGAKAAAAAAAAAAAWGAVADGGRLSG